MLDSNQYIISSNPDRLDSQQYDALRALGIDHIQKLASKLWTDYNVHDPGITILELLCYAITDIGYRTSFNIEDILTPPGKAGPELNEAFYSAAQILTHRPLTVNDYRKMIIDHLPGVKNAWFIPIIDETYIPEMFVASGGGTLTFDVPADQTNNPPLQLQGLYRVRLELEEVEFLNIFQQYNFQTQFPQLQQAISNAYLLSGDNRLIDDDVKTAYVKEAYKTLMANRVLCEDFVEIDIIQYEYVGICADIDLERGTEPDFVLHEMYRLIYNYISPELNLYNITELSNKGKSIEDIFKGTMAERGFIDYDELSQFNNRSVIYTSDIIALIMNIKGVQSVRKIHLSSFLLQQEQDSSIVIGPTDSPFTQIEDAQAYCLHLNDPNKAFRYRLDYAETDTRYVVNKFNFRVDDLSVAASLSTPDEPGYFGTSGSTNTIGIGSKTFVTQAGLSYAANDLIKLFTPSGNNQVAGNVVSYVGTNLIVNVTLISGSGSFSFWNIAPGHTPLTEIVPVLLMADNFKNDLDAPVGKNRNLDKYYSIQNEFPKAYALGQEGISDSETTERKAQRLQLKSYLIFFEQLLADFLAQLNSTKDLLSWRTQSNLYSYQYLKLSPEEIVDLDDLIQNRDTLFDSGQYHTDILENDLTRTDRRNRFLNHLFSRFNESFVELSLVKFIRRYVEPYSDDDIINDKLSFLRVYPEISGNRFHAFDYSEQVWDLPNTSGFEKRVEKKIGLNDPNSDLVSVHALIQPVLQQVGNAIEYVLDANGNIQFVDDRGLDFDESFGIHIIEHILLRPLMSPNAVQASAFLKVCLEGDSYPADCFCRDPYSFRISAVLPGWLPISMDLNFRKFMETLIQEEVPAHIALKICWVGPDQMHQFERAYYSFTNCLRALTLVFPDPLMRERILSNYTLSLSKLVDTINGLENIYPPSYLVGCDDVTYNSDGEIAQHPVILNRTALIDSNDKNYSWVDAADSNMSSFVYPPEASRVAATNFTITLGLDNGGPAIMVENADGAYLNLPFENDGADIPLYFIYDGDNSFHFELAAVDPVTGVGSRVRLDNAMGDGYAVFNLQMQFVENGLTDSLNIILKIYFTSKLQFTKVELFTDKVGNYSLDLLRVSVEEALQDDKEFFIIYGQRANGGDFNFDYNDDYITSALDDFNNDFNNDFGPEGVYAIVPRNLQADGNTLLHMAFEQRSVCNSSRFRPLGGSIFNWFYGIQSLGQTRKEVIITKRVVTPPAPAPEAAIKGKVSAADKTKQAKAKGPRLGGNKANNKKSIYKKK